MRTWWRLHEHLGLKQGVENTAEMMGGFLLAVARGGPTAASGVWHHLDWLRDKLGVPLPTRAPYIEDFKVAEPGHAVR